MISLTPIKWLDYLVYSIIVIIIAWIILRFLRFLLGKFLKRSSEELNVDPTKYHFLKNGLNFIIYLAAIIVILYTIPEFKSLGVSLFASAGILAAIIGFASQAAFSNIISGIFIVIFKPFRVSDIIQVGDRVTGRVEDITLRHTVVRNFENRRYILPNSVISSEVILNSSIIDQKIANFVIVSISYDSDLDFAMKVMQEEAMNHPSLIDNRTPEEIQYDEPVVLMRVMALSDYSIELRATCWSSDFVDGFMMRTDLIKSIKQRFDREGIEIPFPHRTIVNKVGGKVK
jgi:small-conductance mechanosensitive channel